MSRRRRYRPDHPQSPNNRRRWLMLMIVMLVIAGLVIGFAPSLGY